MKKLKEYLIDITLLGIILSAMAGFVWVMTLEPANTGQAAAAVYHGIQCEEK